MPARVSRDGIVVASDLHLVARDAFPYVRLGLVASGTDYLLAWTPRTAGASRIVTRIDREGRPISAAAYPHADAMASDGAGFVVAGGRADKLILTTVGANGATSESVLDEGLQQRPRVAVGTAGGNSVVAWEIGGAIKLAIQNGNEPIRRLPMEYSGVTPAIIQHGGAFLIAWRSVDFLRAVRVSERGEILDSIPLYLAPLPSAARTWALAEGAGEVFIAWDEPRNASEPMMYKQTRIAGRRAPIGQSAGGPVVEISRSSPVQLNPVVVPMGGGYLAVWQEYIDDDYQYGSRTFGRLVAARLDAHGTAIDRDGVIIDPQPVPARFVTVAVDDRGGVILWTNSSSIFARRIRFDGVLEPLTQIGVRSTPYTASPALAWNGEGFLLVTSEGRLAAVRLSRELVPIDAEPFPLGSGNSIAMLKWSGDEYRLVSTLRIIPCYNLCVIQPTGVWLQRLSRDGVLLDERKVSERWAGVLAADCSANECLIAGGGSSIGLVRVASDLTGALHEEEILTTGLVVDRALVWDGKQFHLFWDTRPQKGSAGALFALRVSRDGVPLDSAPDPIAVIPDLGSVGDFYPSSAEPAVASRGHGSILLVFSQYDVRREAGSIKRLFGILRQEITRRHGARR